MGSAWNFILLALQPVQRFAGWVRIPISIGIAIGGPTLVTAVRQELTLGNVVTGLLPTLIILFFVAGVRLQHRADVPSDAPPLDFEVRVPELDWDYLAVADWRDGQVALLKVPNVYMNNRSPSHRMKLRFSFRAQFSSFGDPEVVTIESQPGEALRRQHEGVGDYVPNPKDLKPGDHAEGSLLFATELNGRTIRSGPPWLFKNAQLLVRDEQSGKTFDFPAPGGWDTRQSDPADHS